MTNEEVIEQLFELAESRKSAVDGARDVEALKIAGVAVMMNEWININDKLPEKGRYVLVYDCCTGVQCGTNYGGDIWDFGYGLSRNVTHWKPLPEPPKRSDDHAKQP